MRLVLSKENDYTKRNDNNNYFEEKKEEKKRRKKKKQLSFKIRTQRNYFCSLFNRFVRISKKTCR